MLWVPTFEKNTINRWWCLPCTWRCYVFSIKQSQSRYTMDGKWAVATCERGMLSHIAVSVVVDSGELQTSWLRSGPQWVEELGHMWWFTSVPHQRRPHLPALDSCPGGILEVDSISTWCEWVMRKLRTCFSLRAICRPLFLAIYRHYLIVDPQSLGNS